MSSAVLSYESTNDLAVHLEKIRSTEQAIDPHDAIVLARLGGGVLQFSGTVFPDAAPDEIYAKHETRSSEGRGPHFDISGDYLEADYPWLGVYNLAGKVSLTAAQLPDNLAADYFERFSKPTEAAAQARRAVSRYALDVPDLEIFEGSLSAGTGMILLQKPNGPHIIHNIVPDIPHNPGEYIKLVRPAQKKRTKLVADGGYVTLDELVTGLTVRQDFEDLASVIPPLPGSLPELDSEPDRRRPRERRRRIPAPVLPSRRRSSDGDGGWGSMLID